MSITATMTTNAPLVPTINGIGSSVAAAGSGVVVGVVPVVIAGPVDGEIVEEVHSE
ncbi:MAG: hypothetical protein ACFFCR_11975 [Promethearchaeota archaeon]